MRKVEKIFFLLVLTFFSTSMTSLNATENGKPDPTPTPFVSCGGLLCSYFAGVNFQLSRLDIESQSQVGNLGQLPCQINANIGTDFCSVFPRNALPSNNLTSVVLKGGSVEITQAGVCEAASEVSCRNNPLPAMKIVLDGGKATFDQYPYPGFTFSADRRTIYIAQNSVISFDFAPKILVKDVGRVTATAYLETNPGEYSAEAAEKGNILVISKFDNFIFQRLTQKDLKKNPKAVIKQMQKEITCVKGKLSKKIVKSDIYDYKCPSGFKNK